MSGEERTLEAKLLRWSKKGLELQGHDPEGREAKRVEKALEEKLEGATRTAQELGILPKDEDPKSA